MGLFGLRRQQKFYVFQGVSLGPISHGAVSLLIFDCSPRLNIVITSTCHGLSIASLRSGFLYLVLELWPILAQGKKLKYFWLFLS